MLFQTEPTITCHCGRKKQLVTDVICLACVAIHAKYNAALTVARREKAKFNAVAPSTPVYLNGFRITSVSRGWVYHGYDNKGRHVEVLGGNDAIWQDLLEQAGLPYVPLPKID